MSVRFSAVCFLQVKYKEGKKDLSSSLYHLLPETEEIKFAKAVMELQSEVQQNDKRIGDSDELD